MKTPVEVERIRVSKMGELKRKQNFVDGSVQGGLVRRIFLHWLLFFFVTAMAVLILKTLLGDPSLPFAERFQTEVREFTFLGIIFVAIFPAFMLDTIRFSNRFVGPIHRLRRHLVELGSVGETAEIKFRDNDFWQGIAGEFKVVQERMKTQQAEINSLKAQLTGAGFQTKST